MDVWMGEWMYRFVGGCMDGSTHGWIDGWMDTTQSRREITDHSAGSHNTWRRSSETPWTAHFNWKYNTGKWRDSYGKKKSCKAERKKNTTQENEETVAGRRKVAKQQEKYSILYDGRNINCLDFHRVSLVQTCALQLWKLIIFLLKTNNWRQINKRLMVWWSLFKFDERPPG